MLHGHHSHTTSERARKRATDSRLRAIMVTKTDGTRYYIVHNLRSHARYLVSLHYGTWVCHCEAAKAQTRCKHLQRVLDREERRTKKDALREGT